MHMLFIILAACSTSEPADTATPSIQGAPADSGSWCDCPLTEDGACEVWHLDGDGDGWPAQDSASCHEHPGYILCSTSRDEICPAGWDCDDSDATINDSHGNCP